MSRLGQGQWGAREWGEKRIASLPEGGSGGRRRGGAGGVPEEARSPCAPRIDSGPRPRPGPTLPSPCHQNPRPVQAAPSPATPSAFGRRSGPLPAFPLPSPAARFSAGPPFCSHLGAPHRAQPKHEAHSSKKARHLLGVRNKTAASMPRKERLTHLSPHALHSIHRP